MIEIIFCVLSVLTGWVVIRHHWLTRRQPVRKTAPTGGPWVRPAPRHRIPDDTPR